MSTNNGDKKKEGLLGALARFFGGGSGSGAASSLGSAAGSAAGSSAGLGGLFASKAGVLGMVLGGATIAAGVGVVYNFMGTSSKPVYSPSLFQNAYQEEQAAAASMERQRVNSQAAAEPSTLDMFRDQAKKDGLGFGDEEASESSGAGEEAGISEGASASAGVEAPDYGAGAAPSAGAGKGKLAASLGFGQKSAGGSGTSIPKMQTSGGLSGGIGQKFAPVYRQPAGQASEMRKSMSARVSNSPKYTVPNFNKKGAFGQAKYAGKVGGKAAYSASDAGARTAATEAFAGETTGSGDVAGVPETGAGLGGAGVSAGDSLKANDPNLNMNESEPPPVPEPENVSPWEKYTDMAMKAMLASIVLILLTKILGKWPMLYYAAVCTAIAAMGAAAMVIYSGIKLMTEFGQKWMGGMYVVVGLMLMVQAWEALCGLEKGVDLKTAGGEGCEAGKSFTSTADGMKGTEVYNVGTQNGAAGTYVTKPMGNMSITGGKGIGALLGFGG